MNMWTKKQFIGLVILTAAVHAVLLFFAIPKFSSRLGPSYNQDRFTDGYDQIAENLAVGNGYRFYPDTARTLMREPGYPILLAGLILLLGSSFTAVKLTNMILAFVAAWFMMQIARRFSNDKRMILVPSLLFLFHPGTLIAESRGGVEIVFAALITLFLLTVFKAIESNQWWNYLLSGAVLGITVSVRSVPMLFPAILLAYLLIFESRRVSRVVICRNIALMIIAMLAVLTPWIIRNYSLTQKFVPTASVLGASAHAGQYICMHLSDGEPWWALDRKAARERSELATELGYPFKEGRQGYYQTFYNSKDEIRFSTYLQGRVVQEYKRHPALFLKCVGYNLFNFWFAGKTPMSTAINVIIQLPYLILAAIGAVLGLRGKLAGTVGVLVLFIGYIMAVHAPILAQARYSVPLVPLLSLLAWITLMAARKRVTVRNPLTIGADSVRGELTRIGEPVGRRREGQQ